MGKRAARRQASALVKRSDWRLIFIKTRPRRFTAAVIFAGRVKRVSLICRAAAIGSAAM